MIIVAEKRKGREGERQRKTGRERRQDGEMEED